MKTKIALADDHVMLRNGLANMLRDFDYEIIFQANNGKDFIEKLQNNLMPDIAIMDIHMPVMDGYQTTQWLKQNHPQVKVLALSMYDNENTIIRMIKSGARGYILKDSEPAELQSALQDIMAKGFYHSELVSGKLIKLVNQFSSPGTADVKEFFNLNDKEIEFLKLVCTEMTYKEIADKMCVSPRTVDDYRETLFHKFGLKTRIGLVLFAIKNGIVTI